MKWIIALEIGSENGEFWLNYSVFPTDWKNCDGLEITTTALEKYRN